MVQSGYGRRRDHSPCLGQGPVFVVICVQFIFKPGRYDDEFHRLDTSIDDYARSLPGFVATETWTAQNGTLVNAVYYFHDRKSVAQLARYPEHRDAKKQVDRWYDGYRIIVSDVRATYGDDRLPGPATAGSARPQT